MGAKRNFRRVELLVVLVAAGLLLASLGAVGKTARQRAKGVVCLANLGQLGKGWHKFADDHDGLLVGGCNWSNHDYKDRWVEEPKRTPVYAGDPPSGPYYDYVSMNEVTFEYRKNGLKAGKLWPYVKNSNAYHCPLDSRIIEIPSPRGAFRSYSITGTMRGEDIGGRQGIFAYEKFRQINRPDTKLVFVEECVKDQWQNLGSWMMRTSIPVHPSIIHWVDPMSNNHGNSGSLSFADGHAILKKWEDSRTIELNEVGDATYSHPPEPGNPDLEYIARAYGGLAP